LKCGGGQQRGLRCSAGSRARSIGNRVDTSIAFRRPDIDAAIPQLRQKQRQTDFKPVRPRAAEARSVVGSPSRPLSASVVLSPAFPQLW
jgi:hypothetical protein